MRWADVETCLRKSIGDDEVTLANALGALRRQEMVAWAIWRDKEVVAIMITRIVDNGYAGGRAMLIYGLNGDASDTDWQDACAQLEEVCRTTGIQKLLAYTTQENVARLAVLLNWQQQTILWKEISNG
jgi:hypothetical protein